MEKAGILRVISEIRNDIHKYHNIFDSYTGIMRGHSFSGPEEEYEFTNEYEEKMLFISTGIYYLFLLLFDITQNNGIKNEFIKKIGERYCTSKDLLDGKYYELPDDYFSVLAGDYNDFINPYEILYGLKNDTDAKEKSIEINTLERLLEETNLLCKLSGKIPTSEPKVYNIVKQYIYILFPKSNNVSGLSYPTVAKVYKPDIYVPECNVVIEYKYIDKEDKISSTIAGISDDVKGYKENTEYSIFYAVFYFKTAFITKERFLEIWKEKKFPRNWKPIYVIETN